MFKKQWESIFSYESKQKYNCKEIRIHYLNEEFLSAHLSNNWISAAYIT